MKAYKFRSNSSLEHALDIILNQRLYCSPWAELNDPMEGRFLFSFEGPGKPEYAAVFNELVGSKARRRVCALSESFGSYLMWAHYADGFRGARDRS